MHLEKKQNQQYKVHSISLLPEICTIHKQMKYKYWSLHQVWDQNWIHIFLYETKTNTSWVPCIWIYSA